MKKHTHLWALAVLFFCGVQSAYAGSYQLNDYSITGLGRSYAGVGVVGDDYSAIAFNPAGMSLTQSGMQVGLTAVNLRADINGMSGFADSQSVAGRYGKMDHWVPIPNMFAQYQLNEKTNFGFGIYAPYGLATRYNADWFGATSAIKSTLTIIDFSPAVSYKLTDNFSIGGSLIARYIYGQMTNKLNQQIGGGTSDFELDGWTMSGTLGMMFEPDDTTRFGFSWRFRSTQQVKGDHKIRSNDVASSVMQSYFAPLGITSFDETATGRASPALPETAIFSIYKKVAKVGLSATARWTHWSQSFPEFVMKSDSTLFTNPYAGLMGLAGGEKRAHYNYDNTWSLSFGTDYYYDDNWTFRLGVAYDEGATHNNTTRTYRIPDNDRFWTSVGFSYLLKNTKIDVGYAHLFVRSSKVIASPENGESFSSKYKTHSDILGLQVQYRF